MGIIIFARMSSSRLPGKMLRPLGLTTLLERVVERARLLEYDTILATSIESSDDVLAGRAEEQGVPVFRGSLDDVLGRAVDAARFAGFDAFCRLCGDRPFMPLEDMKRGMDSMRHSYVNGSPLDLVTTQLPAPVPRGLLTEIINTDTLEDIEAHAETDGQREHVTPGFYEHPDEFDILELETSLRSLEKLNFSVDTERDRDLLGKVLECDPDPALPIARAAHLIQKFQRQSEQ